MGMLKIIVTKFRRLDIKKIGTHVFVKKDITSLKVLHVDKQKIFCRNLSYKNKFDKKFCLLTMNIHMFQNLFCQ